MPETPATGPQDRRPHPNLLKYYLLESLLLGPFFLIALIPRFLRFRTLHYHWDDQGITARWGVLFRREISLDFERIQDIHLSSNLFERWLGLAKVQVQTASGSSRAEMTVEGLQDYAQVRDFLYARMRGVRDGASGAAAGGTESPAAMAPPAPMAPMAPTAPTATMATDEVAQALHAAAAELRALRQELAATRSGRAERTRHTGEFEDSGR